MKETLECHQELHSTWILKIYKNSDFGNGRFVRKAIEESEMNLAIRLEDCDILSESTDVLTTIEACDIPPRELLIDENSGKKTAPIGFAY